MISKILKHYEKRRRNELRLYLNNVIADNHIPNCCCSPLYPQKTLINKEIGGNRTEKQLSLQPVEITKSKQVRKEFISTWQSCPFLRLLIPLVTGIALSEYIQCPLTGIGVYGFLTVSALLLTVLYFKKTTSFQSPFFGVVLTLFLLGMGWGGRLLQWQQLAEEWSEESLWYKAMLMDNPSEKSTTFQVPVQLLSTYSEDGKETEIQRRVIISLEKDTLAKSLRAGDALLFFGRIFQPRNSPVLGGFDYATYLRNTGISGQAYVASWRWYKVDAPQTFWSQLSFIDRFRLYFLQARNRMLAPFIAEGGETSALFAAITLGDTSRLSAELKDEYNVTGAAHILALSGSHMALIYICMELLFSFSLYRLPGGRAIGRGCIILLMWSLVFLSGAPSSVVRAAWMYTLMVAASFFSRRTFSVNNLCMAAFFMCLIDPSSLFDVGFQLSFCSVLAILLLHPFLFRLLRTRHIVWDYFLKVISFTLAVQIFILPMQLYYFSSLPLYNLLTNLWIVPLSSLVLFGAMVGFAWQAVVSFAGWEWGIVGESISVVLHTLLSWQNEGIRWMAGLPYISLSVPGFTAVLCWLSYLLFALLFLRKYLSRLVWMYAMLLWGILFIGGLVSHRYASPPSSYMVFYVSRYCPMVQWVSHSGKSQLFPVWKERVASGTDYLRRNTWKRMGISPPQVVQPTDGLWRTPLATVLMLKDVMWLRQEFVTPQRIDYIWVCKGFYGELQEALTSFQVRHIVLDASLSFRQRMRYRHECQRLQLPCHDLAEEGELVVK